MTMSRRENNSLFYSLSLLDYAIVDSNDSPILRYCVACLFELSSLILFLFRTRNANTRTTFDFEFDQIEQFSATFNPLVVSISPKVLADLLRLKQTLQNDFEVFNSKHSANKNGKKKQRRLHVKIENLRMVLESQKTSSIILETSIESSIIYLGQVLHNTTIIVKVLTVDLAIPGKDRRRFIKSDPSQSIELKISPPKQFQDNYKAEGICSGLSIFIAPASLNSLSMILEQFLTPQQEVISTPPVSIEKRNKLNLYSMEPGKVYEMEAVEFPFLAEASEKNQSFGQSRNIFLYIAYDIKFPLLTVTLQGTDTFKIGSNLMLRGEIGADTSCEVDFDLEIALFNKKFSIWEPVLEPLEKDREVNDLQMFPKHLQRHERPSFKSKLTCKGEPRDQADLPLEVKAFDSKATLEVKTSDLQFVFSSSSLQIALNSFYEFTDFEHFEQNHVSENDISTQQLFSFDNQTHVDFKIHPGSKYRFQNAKNGVELQSPIDVAQHSQSDSIAFVHKRPVTGQLITVDQNLYTFYIECPGMTSSVKMFANKIVSRRFHFTPVKPSKSNIGAMMKSFLCHVGATADGQKTITFTDLVKITNHTEYGLKIEDSSSTQSTNFLSIPSKESAFFPPTWTSLRFKPDTPKQYVKNPFSS